MSSRLHTLVLVAGFSALPYGASAQNDTTVIWNDVIQHGVSEIDALIAEGQEALATGDADRAIVRFDAAYALNETRRDAFLLALQARARQGRYDEIIALTSSIADSTDTSLSATRVRFFRAVALAAVGQIEAAETLLERATRYRSDLADANVYYANLAELLVAQGRYDQALIFYQRSLAEYANPTTRMGMAIALEAVGRTDEARQHVIGTLLQDPEAEFLTAPGVFFVPDGQVHLYSALLAEARADGATAAREMAAFSATDAAQVYPSQAAEQIRSRLDIAPVEVTSITIDGCYPSAIARSPNGERFAVYCDYDGVYEFDRDGNEMASTTSEDLWDSRGITYTSTDRLRVLNAQGVFELERTNDQFSIVEQTSFDNYNWTGVQLVRGGEAVLGVGNGTGIEVIPIAANPAPQLTFLPVDWIESARISDDERVVGVSQDSHVQLFAGPSWSELGRHPLSSAGRFTPWTVTPSGRTFISAEPRAVAVYRVPTMQPIRWVPTPWIDGTWDSVGVVTTLDDHTIAIGSQSRIDVIRIPESL